MRKSHTTSKKGGRSSTVFLDSAHWLDIAIVLSDRAMTMAECARRLGLQNSVISRPMREMRREGLLEVDNESLARGTHYWLRPDLIEQVEEETRRGQPFGSLRQNQVVLVVEAERLLDLADALAADDLTRTVVWVAELDAGGRFLVILDGENSSPVAHSVLRAAVEGAGGSCRVGKVSRLMDGAAWRQLLAASRDAAL